MKSNNHSPRIRILLIGIIIIALGIACKLYFVQVVHGEEYSKRAMNKKVQPLFDRGTIYFTSKDGTKVSAATVQEGVSLAINPKELGDAEETYQVLKKYVALDHDIFLEKANKKDDPFEELAKKLEEDTGTEIQKLKIPGVIIYHDAWRTYPAEETAAHVIGLMGYKGDEYSGRYGLESFYDKRLSDIEDVTTSLEPSVEHYVESVLADTKAKWQSDEIGAIVMDPHTGAIIAMSTLPNFNPNDVSSQKNPKVFSNPLVESAYEMGSILKPLTVASGIDVGVITPETTYNDTGTLTVDKKKISNYDGKARGIIPVQEILNQSLNVGIAFVVQKMGNDNLSKYFKSFGFGTLTGIDQPHETKGLAGNLNSTRSIEHITMGYGQGISMSPIAITRALAVLANGGYLVHPYIADQNSEKVQVLKPETVKTVTTMLVQVVDKALRQGTVKMERYSIAAKTGTAQIADPVNGGYYTDRYLHSFFGYFPAYEPKYIIFLYQVYPKNVQYASETLTYPFMDMVKFLINYYEINPDR